MQQAGLRNVTASVVEAVDSSEEQAEVGKQNKHMKKRTENSLNISSNYISVECVTLLKSGSEPVKVESRWQKEGVHLS